MRANTQPDSRESSEPVLVDNAAPTGHEYDGIQEYDNPLPAWWKNVFWATFIFSLGYYAYFQILGEGSTVSETYAEEMRLFRQRLAAEAMGQEVTEEGLGKLMANPAMVTDGKTVFLTRCKQCHADLGQGNIGPNLTDDHWLHGNGSLLSIYKLVSEGSTLKGMPAWSRTLRPMELGQVVAYVGTIRSTHVAGRPPEGTLVSAEERAQALSGASKEEVAQGETTANSAPGTPPAANVESTTAPAKVDARPK